MSVYKSLTTSDVIVTPFKVNKSFTFEGTGLTPTQPNSSSPLVPTLDFPNVQINRYFGKNIQSNPWITGSNPTGPTTSILNSELVYNSVKQLYYTNYLRDKEGSSVLTSSVSIDGVRTGPAGIQPMYDNYLNDTLLANRVFPTGSNDVIGLISIPSGLYGEYIKPGTFVFSLSASLDITDDGNGNLIQESLKVGDIIYQHGMAVLINVVRPTVDGASYENGLYGESVFSGIATGSKGLDSYITGSEITCSFQSTTTIYESQYKCTFSPNEFNYSQNPSIISGSCDNTEGKLYDFATGSYFEPYITTIGLYNNANELIAVGKLSQPLQSSNVTDTTILVNLDL